MQGLVQEWYLPLSLFMVKIVREVNSVYKHILEDADGRDGMAASEV